MNSLRKKISFFFLITILFTFFLSETNADIDNTKDQFNVMSIDLSREEIFNYLGNNLLKDIPKTYKYINVDIKGLTKGTKIYENIQKIIYVDGLPNNSKNIYLKNNLNAFYFYSLVSKITDLDFVSTSNVGELKSRNTKYSDIDFVNKSISSLQVKDENNFSKKQRDQIDILYDVYKTISTEHYDAEKINKEKLLYGAISGLANASDDKYTTFFQPEDYKNFSDDLSGEFEGIGAYIDSQEKGIFVIVSPIKGSPAEKSGILPGDIITKIDGKIVDETFSLKQITSLIKGKAGTNLILTVLRGEKTYDITITRDKITIKDIEYKVINNDIFYIETRIFGENIASEFTQAINELNKNSNIKKIVIDLRNNPGGYLDKVDEILSLFIEEGHPISILDNKGTDFINFAIGGKKIDLSKYKVYLLGNEGTASASEILIGTLKDYYPDIKIVGEKTYGKGSVQSIKTYLDGSSLKYTVAKWFTGLNRKSIDLVGIKPDIEIKFDKEKIINDIDNQLQYILNN